MFFLPTSVIHNPSALSQRFGSSHTSAWMHALCHWSACLKRSLGPWSALPDEGQQAPSHQGKEPAAAKKTRRVVEAPTCEFGPWPPSLLGPTEESASKVLESRSRGVEAQGPWDQVNKKEQTFKSSLRGTHFELTSTCLIDAPQSVRAHQAPNTKSTQRAKDPNHSKEQ